MRRLLIATIGVLAIAAAAPASSTAAARWRSVAPQITVRQSERVARLYSHWFSTARPRSIVCRERDHVCVITQPVAEGTYANWTYIYWVYTWRWANKIHAHFGSFAKTVTLRVRPRSMAELRQPR